MTDNTTLEEEDEDFEPFVYFDEILWEAMSPKIKEYLFNNYQDILLNLEPGQYTELDDLIRNNFRLSANGIADTLHRYRIITDSDEFDKAFESFVPDNKPFQWPVTEHGFFREFPVDDDEPDEFADLHPYEMTEDMKRVQEACKICDKIVNDTQLFYGFLKQGYLYLNPLVQEYLERNAAFDLANTTPEGIVACQRQIDLLVECLLEELHALLFGESL